MGVFNDTRLGTAALLKTIKNDLHDALHYTWGPRHVIVLYSDDVDRKLAPPYWEPA